MPQARWFNNRNGSILGHNYRIYFELYSQNTFYEKFVEGYFGCTDFATLVSFFKQLPLLWGKWKLIFYPISFLTQLLKTRFLSNKFKWVRFSREVMLLGIATKPE